TLQNTPQTYNHDEVHQIIDDIRAGDSSAWSQLISTFEHMITATAVKAGVPYHATDDVVQDTFLALHGNIDNLIDASRLAGWLKITALRVSYKTHRRGNKYIPVGDSLDRILDHRFTDEDIADKLLQEDRVRFLDEFSSSLNKNQRQLLKLLRHESDLKYREMAELLDEKIGTLASRRARLVEALWLLAPEQLLDEESNI